MNAEQLKNYLMLYRFNVEQVKEIDDKILELETRQYGPQGGSIIKMPDGTPPERGSVIRAGMDRIDELKKDEDYVIGKYQIAKCDRFVGTLDGIEKKMVIDKFIKGDKYERMNYKELEEKYYCNNAQMWRTIQHLIDVHIKFINHYE